MFPNKTVTGIRRLHSGKNAHVQNPPLLLKIISRPLKISQRQPILFLSIALSPLHTYLFVHKNRTIISPTVTEPTVTKTCRAVEDFATGYGTAGMVGAAIGLLGGVGRFVIG